jgi:NADPH:quinone reductase-like Zn-dependent oxidoreductase
MSMRAVVVTALGGPEVLQVVEQPSPLAGAGQVLVRVRAAGVNPADIGARVGKIPGGRCRRGSSWGGTSPVRWWRSAPVSPT